jgi:hypothetical protein
MQRREHRNGSGLASLSTLIVTNVTKVVGLGLAVNEGLQPGPADHTVIGFAAICVLGVQVVENVLLEAIARFFGRPGAGDDAGEVRNLPQRELDDPGSTREP